MLGSVIAGKYEILRAVGRGGMGEVFEARHAGLDRSVAIKVLHEKAFQDTAATERFMREARIACRLANVHAVRVFDVDRLPSGRPYLVMELLEGEDLDQLSKRRRIGVGEALKYVIQATEALTEAHDQKLVHRDLKPHNLFLTNGTDGEPCIKVVDFGLAKSITDAASGEVTRTGSIVGTPSYLSPEQIRTPEAIDLRSDLWSLGATLYTLLAGKAPFAAPDVDALIASILETEPEPLRDIRPEIPPDVARVVACALEKNVARRYRDVRAMAKALRAAQSVVGASSTMRDDDVPPPPTEGGGETTVDASTPLAGSDLGDRVVAGRFRLLGTLGKGGMGDVYRAHDTVLDRSVALKVLRGAGAHDKDARRRVVREARAAAALAHPNAVTIFDVGEDKEQVFIAMELVEGESLGAIIVRNEASTDDRLRWLRDAARALQAAHGRGLVHRDVKPENMLVCRDGSLKLLDFGIAKRSAADEDNDSGAESVGPSSLETSTGRQVGTPRYMAPEQRIGMPTDTRTDQYAWGLVAKELLGARLESVSPRLRAAIDRALSTSQEARFPTMAPILDAFEPARKGASTIGIVVLGAGILVVVGGAILLTKWRTHAKPPSPAVAAKTFACLEQRHEDIPLAQGERVGVDIDGAPLLARNLEGLPELRRRSADGWKVANPVSQTFELGQNYRDIFFTGTYERAKPALLAAFDHQGARLVFVFTANDIFSATRLGGNITGIAVSDFGGSSVIVTTSDKTNENNLVTSRGVAITSTRNGDFAPIEDVSATSPSIASSREHMAVAWRMTEGIRFAFVDSFFDPIRPPITITTTSAAPAVIFDGKVATIFWSAPRLMRARVSIDEAKTDAAPASEESAGPTLAAVELANGRWAVAWTSQDKSAVRFAPVEADGSLRAPIEIAKGGSFEDPRATHGRTDTPTILWRNGAAARLVTLACEMR